MGRVFTATGIEYQDLSGSTIVDTVGVSSSLNFPFTSISGTIPAIQGSATSLESIAGGSISFNVQRDDTQALVFYGGHVENPTDWVEVDLVHALPPGTAVGTILDYISGKSVTAGVFFSISGHIPFSFNSGTNTLKLRWKVGAGTATIDGRSLTVMLFGK